MKDNTPENPEIDNFISLYTELLSSELTNVFALQHFDEISDPKIGKLVNSKNEEKELIKLLHDLSYSLGGVPSIIIKKYDKPKEKYDTFINSIINEALTAFWKSRRAVIKAHSQYVVVESMRYKKPFFKSSPPENIVLIIEEYFWDSLEVAYLRLASFWDRVGQILDYAFFNMRQYKKEGFRAIIEKIHSNFEPLLSELEKLPEYKKIWSYSKSEKEEGLKWLLQRRNTITHSASLNTEKPQDYSNRLFESKFNHLELKKEKKLNKTKLAEEIRRLNLHYNQVCILFKDVIKLGTFGATQSISNRRL